MVRSVSEDTLEEFFVMVDERLKYFWLQAIKWLSLLIWQYV